MIDAFEQFFQRTDGKNPIGEAYDDARNALKIAKERAVLKNDQELAKTIWCYERIVRIHRNFVNAFHLMKGKFFYDGWCLLERVEKDLFFLERHYNMSGDFSDPYKLHFIQTHNNQFQSLFPYRLFASPALIIKQQVCSVCGKNISVRNPCGHKIGEIYNGEMCHTIVTELDVAEISLVPVPEQKYSVVFIPDENDPSIDTYNYAHVDYVVRGLNHPFHSWDINWVKVLVPHKEYTDIALDDPCPCGSDIVYKSCCLNKPGIYSDFLHVTFSVKPLNELPSSEINVYVHGKFLKPIPEIDGV